MKIRQVKKSELKNLVSIFIAAYSIKPYYEKWNPKDVLKKLKHYFQSGQIFIASIDSEIVGSIIISEVIWDKGINYQIEEFFVNPNKQKQGIGTELFNFIENKAKKKGIRAISFLANDKSKAYKFYTKKGYKKEMIYLEKIIK
jgi:aminoglycoside 6'-N-acetyltransferase I